MYPGLIRLCSGLFAWGRVGVSPTSAITTIIPLLVNAGGKGVDVVGNGRGGAL
ncbi:unknown [Prevotella sp. CAG:474]|nr:unknown [Prevotella sp. CAG:474]